MKKLILFIPILMILGSCEQTDIDSEIETKNVTVDDGSNFVSNFEYPSNQMIVRYQEDLTEAEKQIRRDAYGVIDVKTCACADPDLELWILDIRGGDGTTGGTIEEKIIVAKEDSGLEGVDFNPSFKHDGDKLLTGFGEANVQIALNKMVASNENVTIAVLDTGVDYNYYGFNQRFLYNTQASDQSCDLEERPDLFGWDFVNQDNDAYDDHGHGTMTTGLIFESLQNDNVDFQILPIKVFDQHGRGNYFDIICGCLLYTSPSPRD